MFFLHPSRSFIDLLFSRRCYPSNIIHVNVRLCYLNDYLCLLNGHLSQLHIFIVKIDRIYNTSMIINNT
ncbi:unnamed protein product, partial [Rotaria sp. Silwood1]